MIFKFFLFFLLNFFVCLKTFAVVEIGFFELDPHTISLGGKSYSGPMLEYFSFIANEMKLEKPEVKLLPLPRLISKLSLNTIDIGIFLAKNSKREQLFYYAIEPIYYMVPSVVISKNFKNNTYAFEKYKVCVWEDGHYPEQFNKLGPDLVKMTGDKISQRCMEMIKNGRVDAFFSPDHFNLKYHLKKMKMDNEYKVIPIVGEPIGLYTVFSKKQVKLKELYEKALKKIKAHESYEDYFHHYLGNLK